MVNGYNRLLTVPAKFLIDGLGYIYDVWQRRPYFGEIITNNGVKVGVSLSFEKQLEFLTKNGNPTTESVVRDVLMSPGVIINVYNKQEIKPGYRYDDFSLVGTATRAGGKIVFINSAENINKMLNSSVSLVNYNGIFDKTLEYINHDKGAIAARLGNIGMEPASMLLNIIIPKARQKKLPDGSDHTHIPWYIYPFSHYNGDWFTLAGLGAVARAFVPDQMGEFYRWAKGLKLVQSPANSLYKFKNYAIENLFSLEPIDIDAKVSDQISKARQEILNSIENPKVAEVKADMASATMFSMAYMLKLPETIFQAYFIMIPTRESFDWIEKSLTKAYEYAAKDSLSKLVGFVDYNSESNFKRVIKKLLDLQSKNEITAVGALEKVKLLSSGVNLKDTIESFSKGTSKRAIKTICDFVLKDENKAQFKAFFKEAKSFKLSYTSEVIVKVIGFIAVYQFAKTMISPFASTIKEKLDDSYLYVENKISNAYEWSYNNVKDSSSYLAIKEQIIISSDNIHNIELPDTSSLIELYLGTKYMISDSMVFVANKALSYKLVSDMYNMVFPQGGDSEDEVCAITVAKLNLEYNESYIADIEGAKLSLGADIEGAKLKDNDDLVPLDGQACSAAEECGKIILLDSEL